MTVNDPRGFSADRNICEVATRMAAYMLGRAPAAPVEPDRTAGAVHLGGPNVAVTQVRGLLRSLCVLDLVATRAGYAHTDGTPY